MAIIFGVLGYLNIRLHRQHLEQTVLADAARMSSVIKRNTSYYMLRNQRDGLYHSITDMANEPEMVRIRIINDQGRISFSSDPSEINKFVDQAMKAQDAQPIGQAAIRMPEREAEFPHLSAAQQRTRARCHRSNRKFARLQQRRMSRTSRRSENAGHSRHQYFPWHAANEMLPKAPASSPSTRSSAFSGSHFSAPLLFATCSAVL